MTSKLVSGEPMNKRKWLAWLVFALGLVLFLVTVALESSACQTLIDPTNPRPALAYGYFTIPVSGLVFGLLGALIIGSQPRNRIGWLMLLAMLGFGAVILAQSYSICALRGQEPLPYGAESFWFLALLFIIAYLSIILIFLLFPNGRFLSPRWRTVSLLLIALVLAVSLLSNLVPGTFGESTLIMSIENPIAWPLLAYPGLREQLELVDLVLSAVLMFTAVGALITRWRRSEGETRQQMKWFVFFAAVAGSLFFLVELVGVTLYPPLFDGWFYFFEVAFFFIGLPVFIGIAVLKYRLYDIDIIIRKTLQYGLLTAVLVAVYFTVVLLAQSAFVALTGQESALAIVLSTLVIAALFNPLRRRLQTFINRRFYRGSYDTAQTLALFARAVRDEVDTGMLARLLQSTVDETMRPETAQVWINGEARKLENEDWKLGTGK